jgi:hypothetical protein
MFGRPAFRDGPSDESAPPSFTDLMRMQPSAPVKPGDTAGSMNPSGTCFVPLFRSMYFKPSWCEENSARLAMASPKTTPCFVVFISNPQHNVLMHHQTTEENPLSQFGKKSTVLYWDYHVINICKCQAEWTVYDSSTTLGRPVTLSRWIQSTFPRDSRMSHYSPRFRIVSREFFIKDFSSDRTGLSGIQVDKNYWPPWPMIYNGKYSNLKDYVDMTKPNDKGKVVNLDGLVKFFYGTSVIPGGQVGPGQETKYG